MEQGQKSQRQWWIEGKNCPMCKCYSSETKGIMAFGSQGTKQSHSAQHTSLEVNLERHKRVAASAWARSSRELRGRQVLYRVSGSRELFRAVWDWWNFVAWSWGELRNWWDFEFRDRWASVALSWIFFSVVELYHLHLKGLEKASRSSQWSETTLFWVRYSLIGGF